MGNHPLCIFSGSAHSQLANEIAGVLGITLGKSTSQYFQDTEIYITIKEVVRIQVIFLFNCIITR